MLKNLKSLFVVEEEEVSKGNASKETPSKSQRQAIPKGAPVISESQEGKKGKVSSKFTEVLLGSMEKADLEGFDYLEYKKSLQSLAKMPMDEATRYKSAYAMAQTMGVSPDKLVQTAQHYINALSKEEQKFEQALQSQKEKQVGAKLQQFKQLEQLVAKKAEQIKLLTQEIEQHQKQMEATKKEVSGSSVKIETTKNNFIASYNMIVAKIQEDIDKMKQYLA